MVFGKTIGFLNEKKETRKKIAMMIKKPKNQEYKEGVE